MRRLLMILCLVGTGCAAQQYYYQPAELATATLSGYPAARYEIPPEKPAGVVRIATFGIASIDIEGRSSIPALHVRLSVANNSGQTAWTLDTRDVRVQWGRGEAGGSAFTNAENPGLPLVQIPRGQERSIDLYYPLPRGLEDAEEIPRFDVLWTVQTDTRAVVERTPFERMRVEPQMSSSAFYHYGVGLSPYWWYDPFFAPRTVVIYQARPRVRFVGPRR